MMNWQNDSIRKVNDSIDMIYEQSLYLCDKLTEIKLKSQYYTNKDRKTLDFTDVDLEVGCIVKNLESLILKIRDLNHELYKEYFKHLKENK